MGLFGLVEVDVEGLVEELVLEVTLREYVLLRSMLRTVKLLRESKVEDPLARLEGILREALYATEQRIEKLAAASSDAAAVITGETERMMSRKHSGERIN